MSQFDWSDSIVTDELELERTSEAVIISSTISAYIHTEQIVNPSTLSHAYTLTHIPTSTFTHSHSPSHAHTFTFILSHTHTDTKESAFVYALTSALTVHQITSACSSGDLAPMCGCDVSRNGLTTVQGWKWGSCSDNVSYGITYAQNFLDAREIEDTDVTINEEVATAEVHLHNNAAGRRVSRR